MKFLFSVIIPTYNRAEGLKRALDSLVTQTVTDFEVIVCDDGSTDNTKEVAERFKDRLHLKYIWQENWGGPARPRNRGITAAQGDWICFLDSDDLWYPNKLEVVSAYLSKGDIIYHKLDIYTTKGKKLFRRSIGRRVSSPAFIDLIVNGNAISNSSVVVKKELLRQVGGFCEDKDLIAVEDYDLWLMLGKISDRFYYISRSLGGYWAGDLSITEISKKQMSRIEALHQKHLPDITHEHRRDADAFKKYCFGGICYRMGLLDEALPLLIKAKYVRSPLLKFKSYCFRLLIYIRSFR